ncbi:MAG: hypothetical protein ACE5GT_15465 [Rhodospirillales bacterium]
MGAEPAPAARAVLGPAPRAALRQAVTEAPAELPCLVRLEGAADCRILRPLAETAGAAARVIRMARAAESAGRSPMAPLAVKGAAAVARQGAPQAGVAEALTRQQAGL